MSTDIWNPDRIEYWEMKALGLVAALKELEPENIKYLKRQLKKEQAQLNPKIIVKKRAMLEEELKAVHEKIETLKNPQPKETENEKIDISGHYIYHNDDTSVGTEQCGPADNEAD